MSIRDINEDSIHSWRLIIIGGRRQSSLYLSTRVKYHRLLNSHKVQFIYVFTNRKFKLEHKDICAIRSLRNFIAFFKLLEHLANQGNIDVNFIQNEYIYLTIKQI